MLALRILLIYNLVKSTGIKQIDNNPNANNSRQPIPFNFTQTSKIKIKLVEHDDNSHNAEKQNKLRYFGFIYYYSDN